MRPVLFVLAVAMCTLGTTLFAQAPPNRGATARSSPPRLIAPPAGAPLIERLPSVTQAVRPASFVEPVVAPPSNVPSPLPAPQEDVLGVRVDERNRYPIDLPTALRLAEANNLLVAFAREQVSLAMARVDAASALWLPAIQGGGSYSRHEGAIQRIEGVQIQTSRGGYNAGLGAGAYGTTTPQVSGLYANFALADVLFQPLAARRFADARGRAAAAVTNDTLLQVALGYFELLRAGEDLAISRAIEAEARQLVQVTAAYAESGQGLTADANRARAELAVRVNDVMRSREAQRVGSARLAQVLRLDPTVELQPADDVVVPLDIIPPDAPVKELVIQGLSTRPELAENRELVAEAAVRLRRERMAMLVPSIVMGASYMGLGSGINEQMAPFHDRFDFDALAYWQVRNFGFGEAAARRGAQATVRAAQWKQLAMLDLVAREVVEAHAQVQMRHGQVDVARWGVEVATASHRQNLDRIEQAKGLPIESLQAIQALAQARREYLRAIIDYNSAQFALYRAVGWPVKDPNWTMPTAGEPREP